MAARLKKARELTLKNPQELLSVVIRGGAYRLPIGCPAQMALSAANVSLRFTCFPARSMNVQHISQAYASSPLSAHTQSKHLPPHPGTRALPFGIKLSTHQIYQIKGYQLIPQRLKKIPSWSARICVPLSLSRREFGHANRPNKGKEPV